LQKKFRGRVRNVSKLAPVFSERVSTVSQSVRPLPTTGRELSFRGLFTLSGDERIKVSITPCGVKPHIAFFNVLFRLCLAAFRLLNRQDSIMTLPSRSMVFLKFFNQILMMSQFASIQQVM
jgi:hypothetical protein